MRHNYWKNHSFDYMGLCVGPRLQLLKFESAQRSPGNFINMQILIQYISGQWEAACQHWHGCCYPQTTQGVVRLWSKPLSPSRWDLQLGQGVAVSTRTDCDRGHVVAGYTQVHHILVPRSSPIPHKLSQTLGGEAGRLSLTSLLRYVKCTFITVPVVLSEAFKEILHI